MQSLDVISGYADKLEAANHTGLLCHVYAAVNRRPVDDPALKQYFLRRGWIPGTHTHTRTPAYDSPPAPDDGVRTRAAIASPRVGPSVIRGRPRTPCPPGRAGGRQADAAPDWLTRTS